MGVPQGGVLSPILFIIFLNDFLINENCSFKFADDSSIVVTGENTDDLRRKLGLSCAGVERWCSTWRMVVNGGKTEIILFNCETSGLKAPVLNGDPCQIKSFTKSLGMVIDNQLTYRQHAEATAEKENREWNTKSSLCNNKWSLTIATLMLLYKTTIVPLLLYASPILFERNRCSMQRVQNSFIRAVFDRSCSPNIESCQVLLGVPPIDILSMSINIKFLIKVKFANDLLTAAHDSSVLRQKSVAKFLESRLRRFAKLLNNDSRFYTVDKINDFIELMWRRRATYNQVEKVWSKKLRSKLVEK